MGLWGVKSLLLHSSGTVLWNGLCGSRFSALPLHAEFLLDFGFLVLPKGKVIKHGLVNPYLITKSSIVLCGGYTPGKTGIFCATIQLQLERSFSQASHFFALFIFPVTLLLHSGLFFSDDSLRSELAHSAPPDILVFVAGSVLSDYFLRSVFLPFLFTGPVFFLEKRPAVSVFILFKKSSILFDNCVYQHYFNLSYSY
jgi:hypothetical protein